MKQCTKCMRVRPLEEFHRQAARLDGRKAQCVDCGRAAARGYYHRDPQRSREASKRSKLRPGVRERENTLRVLRRKARPAQTLVELAKIRARLKGLPFDLVPADVPIPECCPVLGIPLVWGRSRRQVDDSPTLDRIVPADGYVRENVRVISWRANRLKSDATLAELRAVVAYYEAALEIHEQLVREGRAGELEALP